MQTCNSIGPRHKSSGRVNGAPPSRRERDSIKAPDSLILAVRITGSIAQIIVELLPRFAGGGQVLEGKLRSFEACCFNNPTSCPETFVFTGTCSLID